MNVDPDNYWEVTAQQREAGAAHPPLHSAQRCQVAVIGGGYTGLSAALELARAGVDVRLLEARHMGWGASGRNGGFCCVGSAKLGYATMIRRHGVLPSRELFQAQLRAVHEVEEIAAREQIPLQRQGKGELEIAHHPTVIPELRERVELLRSAFGYSAELLDPAALSEQVGVIGQHGGLHMPDGFGLHPLDYVRGLASAAARAGAQLHPHSAVTRWETRSDGHHLHTADGMLTARQVVVATAGYTPEPLHPRLGGTVLTMPSNILVTRPLTSAELQAQGWCTETPVADSRNLVHYFRLLPDGRFLFGGRGGVHQHDADLPRLQSMLVARLHRLFPAWRAVPHTHFWSGQLCMARDLLPHIGGLDGVDNAFAALCYHGNGVAMASWAGRAVARTLLGERAVIPALLRRPLPRFPFPRLRPAYLRLALAGYALADSEAAASFKSWSSR